MFSLAGKKIWVAGHGGMVGSALMRRLARESCTLLTATRGELDLRRQIEVEQWMDAHRPDAVFLAAATVGGIFANDAHPADFIYDNLAIETNIIHAAWRAGVKKLLFLGSSCIYPKFAAQPIGEDALLSGPLEPSNQWYAIAKIAGLKLAQAYRRQHGCDFISAMPTNLYGINDTFDDRLSHVIPALMQRIHHAKLQGLPEVSIWGGGAARRDFLFSEELADALVFLMTHYSGDAPVNIGSGHDIAIADLARLIADITGYPGTLTFDPTKPEGTPLKILDISTMTSLGWTPTLPLRNGLQQTYDWFLSQPAEALRIYKNQ